MDFFSTANGHGMCKVLALFRSGLAPAAVSPVMPGDSADHWAALVEAEGIGVVAVSQE